MMSDNLRDYTFSDQCLLRFDQTLRLLSGQLVQAYRPNPAETLPEPALTAAQKQYVAGLMRVNHTGEVCAQALYQGQSLTTRSAAIKVKLEQAAQEEMDHLAWCAERLQELNSHTSFLNPFWYVGSLAIGMTAGFIGDAVNLGFLAETERQVEQHLTNHLNQLPTNDQKSRVILEQMRIDEQQHATTATQAGAAELPVLVKWMMRGMSKIMTKTAFWV